MFPPDPRVDLSREFFVALLALPAVTPLWWERRKFAATAASSPPGSGGEADES